MANNSDNIERISQRLDMLDQRLDNIDSMVTAVIERIMVQPITMTVICPHCNKNIELGFIGTESSESDLIS